jgi:hypothetical protein
MRSKAPRLPAQHVPWSRSGSLVPSGLEQDFKEYRTSYANVLLTLRKLGGKASLKSLVCEINDGHYDKSLVDQVRRRLEDLEKLGYVEKIGRGWWRLRSIPSPVIDPDLKIFFTATNIYPRDPLVKGPLLCDEFLRYRECRQVQWFEEGYNIPLKIAQEYFRKWYDYELSIGLLSESEISYIQLYVVHSTAHPVGVIAAELSRIVGVDLLPLLHLDVRHCGCDLIVEDWLLRKQLCDLALIFTKFITSLLVTCNSDPVLRQLADKLLRQYVAFVKRGLYLA